MGTFQFLGQMRTIKLMHALKIVFTGVMATVWDIYDSFNKENTTAENDRIDYPERTLKTIKGPESSSSTVDTGNANPILINNIHFEHFNMCDYSCICVQAVP